MPNIPVVKNLTATSVGILNAIRDLSSPAYQAGVPVATATNESIQQIGDNILGFQSRTNEFLNTLVGMIAFQTYAHRAWRNPWKFFKKGEILTGETIEEIYVHMTLPYVYQLKEDGQTMENFITMYKPKVSTAFHSLNSQLRYPVSITFEMLRRAFRSIEGVRNLIEEIIAQVYSAVETDEYELMKYMLARVIVDGKLATGTVTTAADDPAQTAKNFTKEIIAVSDKMLFNTPDYTIAGVENTTPKDEQYLILTPEMKADINVEVLAMAFNMDKASFAGHMLLIDSWTKFRWDRLKLMMAADPTFAEFTEDEIQILDGVMGLILDINAMQCYDNLLTMRVDQLGSDLINQYNLHAWKIVSFSPFRNAYLLTGDGGTVTAVVYDEATLSGAQNATLVDGLKSYTSDGAVSLKGQWCYSTNAGFSSYTPVEIGNQTDYTCSLLTEKQIEIAFKSTGTKYLAFLPDNITGTPAAFMGTNKITVTIS